MLIPCIFHQIWLGPEPFPPEYKGYQRSWTRRNPGWELRLWTEDDLPTDLERREIYELLRRPAERADMLRLELLYRFGGVYVDADFECIRPIQPLLEGVEFFCAYNDPGRVNNAIIGSIPGHPLLAQGIREIRPRSTYGAVDKKATGPVFFGRLVAQFPDVTIFDQELFYPRTPDGAANAYAVHHETSSWKASADLVKDAKRAKHRLAVAQDELARLKRRHEVALAEIEALRGGSGARGTALRLKRLLTVRSNPRRRARLALGRLRSIVRPR